MIYEVFILKPNTFNHKGVIMNSQNALLVFLGAFCLAIALVVGYTVFSKAEKINKRTTTTTPYQNYVSDIKLFTQFNDDIEEFKAINKEGVEYLEYGKVQFTTKGISNVYFFTYYPYDDNYPYRLIFKVNKDRLADKVKVLRVKK